jgi:peptidoglycan biosynthesis protein MviN/MurJ (putative lipid II flippase)
MAIIGAWTFMYTGSILAAGIAGVIAGIVQEVSARLFYNHGTTHIDPPAVAIAICTLLVNLLMKPEFLNMAALFK